MKIKQSQWQALILSIPSIIGLILISVPSPILPWFPTNISVANILFNLSFCLLVSYHARLALRFDKQDERRSVIFKINTLIPVVFFGGYLCYVVYLFINKYKFYNSAHEHGPMPISKYGVIGWLVVIMIIYGLVNFLFINNQYVLNRIKKQKDINRQATLKLSYWLPMREFVRTSVWIFAGSMMLSVILDIITLTKVH